MNIVMFIQLVIAVTILGIIVAITAWHLMLDDLSEQYATLAEWHLELSCDHEDAEELADFKKMERSFHRLQWVHNHLVPDWVWTIRSWL